MGANTFRNTARMFAEGGPDIGDAWGQRYRELPATVISSTLEDTLGWLLDPRTLDGRTQELIYRPTLHGA